MEHTLDGPSGEYVLEWPAGKNAFLPRADGVENALSVVGGVAASVLELAAIPQSGAAG